MAHRHRKARQPSFKLGQGNYYPAYGPSWENNLHYRYSKYSPQRPNYPFAPYPRYFPQQRYSQPCYYCGHSQQYPKQLPYYVDQGKNPYSQQLVAHKHSAQAVQYPYQQKKQKTVPKIRHFGSVSVNQVHHLPPPYQFKTRSK